MSYISFLRPPLRGIFFWVLCHPVPTLLLGILTTVVSIYLTTRITIQSNFADLLPSSEPSVRELRHLEKIVGGASFVVLTVDTDHSELVPPFLDAVALRLANHPDLRYLDYRPPVAFFRRHALQYLSISELRQFVERTRRRIDRAKLQSFAVDFSQPGDDKVTLADFEARYPHFFQDHDYYQSADGRLFVMLIKPNGRATDTVLTRRVLADIEVAVAQARVEIGDPASDGGALRVRLTGPYVKAMAQNVIAQRDAKRVALLSMVATLLFLLGYFRRKRALVLIGVPLAMSAAWSMASAYLCFGTLNFFTALATAVLLGLSADYGIHLYSNYLIHRHAGQAPVEALRRTYAHLGLALWAVAITTVAGFLALALSHFKAFYQFGIIVAIGMIWCLVAMSTVFPALTLLMARWRPERERAVASISSLQGIANRAAPWVTGRVPLVAGVVLCLLCCIPIAMGRIRFDYNFSNILGEQPTRALDARVDTIFTHSINPEIARAETAEDAAAFAAAVRATKAQHAARPEGTTIQTALALADFVPGDQRKKLPLIRALRSAFTDTVLRGLTAEERATYNRMAPALDPTPIVAADLPASIVTKFRDLQGDQGKFLFIFPNFDPANGRKFMQFVDELRSVQCAACRHPVTFSGESVIFYEIIQRMFHDGRWVMCASLLGVLLALWPAFPQVKKVVRCFTPYVVGLIWMLGIMGALDIPFTLINLAVIPILIGIGIDYPIYLYQQALHFGRDQLPTAYATVAPPIFGSAASTIVGFACLLFAHNGGARSFGLVAVIGLSTCMIATLVWFPSWLQWLERRETAAEHMAEAAAIPRAAEM